MTDEQAAGDLGRKRRNRWGAMAPEEEAPVISVPVAESVTGATLTTVEDDSQKKPRRSRWATATSDGDATGISSAVPLHPAVAALTMPGLSIPTIQPLSEEVIQQTVVLNLQLQQINAKLLTVVSDAALIESNPNRSASPPPRYDSNGKRTNTREVRMREALTVQRVSIIEQLLKLNPMFVPPADFVKQKPFRKVYFPKHVDPNFNYIGLIIGPRGNTQKQMEQETGCKISIRGKGSAKEGSKGRATKAQIDEDDELHVHLQGDSMDNVEKAVKLIEAILRPVDDTLNEHKQKQLRELALINGTLREDEYCPVCGEKGHRQFDCPYRAKAFKAAGVKCAICGDLSHPTRDCPMNQDGQQSAAALDNEYDSFLAELTGKGPRPKGDGPARDVRVAPEPQRSGPVELDPNEAYVRSTDSVPEVPVSTSSLTSERAAPIELPVMLPNTPTPMPNAYSNGWASAAPVPPVSTLPPPPMAPSAPAAFNQGAYAYNMYPGMCYPSTYADPAAMMAYYQYANYYQQQQQQQHVSATQPPPPPPPAVDPLQPPPPPPA